MADYAIYLLDKEGNVTNWNLGTKDQGLPATEIIGSHFRAFTQMKTGHRASRRRRLTQSTKQAVSRKRLARSQDGSRFWAHVVIDAIRDDKGDLLGYTKITRDITERKESQQQLEKALRPFPVTENGRHWPTNRQDCHD